MNRTPKHFPKQNFANLTAAIHPMVQFLVSNHPTYAGSDWSIIEAYDGSTREVPADPTDLDSFTGGFGWRNDVATVTVGDWIVLRTVRGGTEFELYIELESTSLFRVLQMPLDDFVTGGPVVTPPTLPSVLNGGNNTGFTIAADYTVIADSGVAIFLMDAGGTSVTWMYHGDVDNGGSENTRPFVAKSVTSNVHVEHGSGDTNRWYGYDPFQNAVIGGTWMYLSNNDASNDVLQLDFSGDDLMGFHRATPIAVYNFGVSGGFYGYLRHVFVGHTDLGSSGTLDNRSFLFRNDESGTSGAIVMTWDRETAYP